jgi:hypothetical protein
MAAQPSVIGEGALVQINRGGVEEDDPLLGKGAKELATGAGEHRPNSMVGRYNFRRYVERYFRHPESP